MAEAITIQTRITEVEAAIHALMTGARVVEIADADGSRLKYSEAILPQLREYLAWLQQQLAAAAGQKRRPIFVEYGR